MEKHIYSSLEVSNIRSNIDRIEKRLGHPIPGGALNYDELSHNILNSSEIGNICHNINLVNKRQGRHTHLSSYNPAEDHPIVALITIIILIIAAIMAHFD